MRVVASVQAKRGSSRGLVHYLAHSKVDPEREPQNSREVFNAFADELSVKSANNSMRVGIAKGRPSNDELHHLVLSFRDDDYRKLGTKEAGRKKALKEITRVAIKSFETSINAERLLWTAAVHRNTRNPHVHIAIQKQYLTKEIARKTLTKIPREALPHYVVRDNEMVLVNGHLIDAATEKMEAIIGRERMHDKAPKRSERGTTFETRKLAMRIAEERKILARGIVAEYELLRIETRIESLLDRGGKMRFTVSDPVTGRKKRLSLQELQKHDTRNETGEPTQAERQIRTILHKMLAKEEAAKEHLLTNSSEVLRDAKLIRSEYKKSGRQLPIPLLSKEEVDRLQETCLEASDIRRFSYLERIRTDLARSGEIEPRSREDLRSILARRNISELRSHLSEKMHKELSEKGYYLRVELDERSVSLADLDREQKDQSNSPHSFLEKVKAAASRLSKNRAVSAQATPTDPLRDQVAEKLTGQLASIRKEGKVEQNKAKILAGILNANPENGTIDPSYSPEQIEEIGKLSVQLRLKSDYENSWKQQRSIIESAGHDSLVYRNLIKTDPAASFSEHRKGIIAGRALAREIVARIEFDQAKDDLRSFQDGKRFQKFAMEDKRSNSTSYLSLHDVDLPRKTSLCDRTVNELFESRDHRKLRRTVSGLVEDKELRLKDDVTAAKEIMVSASRHASEFKESSYFGLKRETVFMPIFTHPEITMLERRALKTRNPKEAERLRTLVEAAEDRSIRSVGELLRDFESPKTIHAEVKEIDIPKHDPADENRKQRDLERTTPIRRPQHVMEGPFR